MPREELTDIPSFAANRDEAVSSAPRNAIPAKSGAAVAGMGMMSRLVLTVALASAGVACAWAWQLQLLLDKEQERQTAILARVAGLEDLLSDTDESVSKSAAAMGAQLRLLDTEVRKLWDARKVSNGSIKKIEKDIENTGKKITGLLSESNNHKNQLNSIGTELASLTEVAGDLERLAASAQQAQTNAERLADGLNKSNLERAALRKQVASNAEWIDSINAFRPQVNTKIAELEAELRLLSAPPMQ